MPQNENVAIERFSFGVVISCSRGLQRCAGFFIGLASLCFGSSVMANTSSGESATEQMARAQAMRLAPKGSTITSVDCQEKDVGFSTRFRCTAHWIQ